MLPLPKLGVTAYLAPSARAVAIQSDREAVNLLAQEAVNLLAQAVVNQLGRAVAKRQIATSLLGWIPIHYVLIRNRNGDRQRLTRLASDTVFSLCSGRTS